MSSRFSRLQEKRCHLPHDKNSNKAEQCAANGACEERGEIPAAHQQCATKVFFQHRTEDETQHERSSVQLQAHENITDETKAGGDKNVIQGVVDDVGANAVEEKDRWKQHALRDLENREPIAHQRHVENRSEEHTSELQSPDHLVCRLLLEKKKKIKKQSKKLLTDTVLRLKDRQYVMSDGKKNS